MTYAISPYYLHKAVIGFYSNVTGSPVTNITDIPAESLAIMMHMRYIDLIQARMQADLTRGLSLRRLARRYGVGVRIVRTVKAVSQ